MMIQPATEIKRRRVLDIASLAKGKSGSAQFTHDNIAESLRFTFVIGGAELMPANGGTN